MNETLEHSPTFLAEHCSMPFCKGCGHTHVLRKLNDALKESHYSPKDVSLVTDIGCIGLADGLFPSVHTVHTTHGRSTAFATGIELADSILKASKLKTIVLIGDGGAMIGLLHLVNAALLNVDVTVLLCNNFLFGMTGGQNSAFSPLEFNTPTTPRGNIVPPLDMCRMMIDAHAPFVARKLATDHDLAETMRQAIDSPGFALVEIVELCTEYAMTRNQLNGSALSKIIVAQGQQLGILQEAGDRPAFESLYKSKFFSAATKSNANSGQGIRICSENNLRKKTGIILAGSAGERVQSAAGLFCEAAVASRLYTTQKNDNPVTQGSGFSLSEVCLSPSEIHFTGIEHPDVTIAVSEDGLRELVERGSLSELLASSILLIDESLAQPETQAKVYRHPFRKLCGVDKAALGALMYYVMMSQIYPREVFENVIREKYRLTAPPFSQAFYSSIRF